MNKSCLSILVAVFLVIVAVCAFVGFKVSKLNTSSKKYVDEAIPLIIANWDKEELLKRASPELKKVATDDDITKLFSELKSKLGAFVKYNGATGGANMSYTSENGKVISAAYKASAEFEHGTANIDFKVIQHGGDWQVLTFYVNVPLGAK